MKKRFKVFTFIALAGVLFAGAVIAHHEEKAVGVAAVDLPTEQVDVIKLKIEIGEGPASWSPPLVFHGFDYKEAATLDGWVYDNGFIGPDRFVDGVFAFPWYVTSVEVQAIATQAHSEWTQYHKPDFITIDAGKLHTIKLTAWGKPFVHEHTHVEGATASRYLLEPEYNSGVDASRTRLWVNRGHYNNEDGTSIVALETNGKLYRPSGYEAKDESLHYAYYDIRISELTGKSLRFHKLKSDLTELWNSSSAHSYTAGDSSSLFIIPANNVEWGETDPLLIAAANELTLGKVTGPFNVSFLAKVLEGYLTCQPSLENGYLAFRNIEENFIPIKNYGTEEAPNYGWDTVGTLSEEEITDYPGTGTSLYSGARGEGTAVNAQAKYDYLSLMYELHSGEGIQIANNTNYTNNEAIITIVVMALGVATLAGIYFFRKRKSA